MTRSLISGADGVVPAQKCLRLCTLDRGFRREEPPRRSAPPLLTWEFRHCSGSGTGSAVETGAVVGIEQGGLRRILLMISTTCLEKPAQRTLRLSHSFHSAGGE